MTSRAVSIHPYFKIHPGQTEAVLARLPLFLEKAAKEPKMLQYGFTRNEEVLFCREAYLDAEGALAHVANVGELLAELLKSADLIRLEIHGPSEELEKLKSPLAHLPVSWFPCVE